jgi:hypothetical protein
MISQVLKVSIFGVYVGESAGFETAKIPVLTMLYHRYGFVRLSEAITGLAKSFGAAWSSPSPTAIG